MDEYSGKRATGGLVVPRKGSGLVLRDTADHQDQNAQFCSRLGCNGRLNHTKGNQIGSSEKPKSSKSSFRSNGKEIIGSSSKTYPVVTAARKSFQESGKKLSIQLGTDSSATSSVQDEPEVEELVSSSGNIDTDLQSEVEDAESSKASLMEVRSSIVASNTRHRKICHQKSTLASQNSTVGSAISLASKTTNQVAGSSSNARKYGFRSRICHSTSDFVPQGCSSSESDTSRRSYMVKKRNPEGESSSSNRGKKMSDPASGEHVSLSTSGVSISGSRRARNWPPSRYNGIAPVGPRRSVNGNTRAGLYNQVDGNNSSLTESDVMISQVPHPEIPININMPCSSHQVSAEASSSRPSSYCRPGSSCDSLLGIMPSPVELDISCLMNRGGMRSYNMDGIAEVLLALERIEHDEELTYEQLRALETNLFLGGLNFYDQHRDMRLDIDNMSYEELLALEERMGTVSTALSEEELPKCIGRSIYESTPQGEGATGCSVDGDDTKCSICQEEYAVGDEMGKLGCEHGYHLVCIQQWLRLKNWCPICKASATPSPSSPAL